MPLPKIIVATSDSQVGSAFENMLVGSGGFDVIFVRDGKIADSLIRTSYVDLLVVGEKLGDGDGVEFGAQLIERYPYLSVILLGQAGDLESYRQALHRGFWDCIPLPLQKEETVRLVRFCLERRARLQNWINHESRRGIRIVQRQLDNMQALQRVAQTVTGLLDLDSILSTVVDAAVELTGAEEGNLLLLDEATGELYMRASRNFQEDFARRFRLPMHDSLAGQALRTGQPVIVHADTPQKIKTAYLVQTLAYMPLRVHGRVIGVLGVDNRKSASPFSEEHLAMAATLADYAAIAIENAHAYQLTELERRKLETILTNVVDGVLVVDEDGRILIANQTCAQAFGVEGEKLVGRSVHDAIHHQDVLEIFASDRVHPSRLEVALEDGRVFNAQVTPIAEVGLVVTMQDITHLKELDRIKSDFVSTVSHDLRSPLTTILGYVELIGRAGPVTEQQREFIRRIQFSVHSITSLINDLLELGRIEAGFDARKEIVVVKTVVQEAADALRSRLVEKQQELVMDIPANLPTVLGNPVRLRQMVANLLSNANRFTAAQGKINLKITAEANQMILQVKDTGCGISPADQPYIFDKFYRGSNVTGDMPGTGLGLAIVKSIVENHSGRIWVDSAPGQGASFTVVLPVTDSGL